MKPDLITIHTEPGWPSIMEVAGRRYPVEPGWWVVIAEITAAFYDAATWSFHPRPEVALFQSSAFGQIRHDWDLAEVLAITSDGEAWRMTNVDRPKPTPPVTPSTNFDGCTWLTHYIYNDRPDNPFGPTDKDCN